VIFVDFVFISGTKKPVILSNTGLLIRPMGGSEAYKYFKSLFVKI